MRAILVFITILFTQLVLAENFPAPDRKDARVYVPAQYDQAKAWPVVVLLHGYLGSDGVVDSYFGYSKEVSNRGFILIVPNGRADSGGFQFWNATDACCDFDHTGTDDVAYITSLLNEVGAKYHIDKNRIYAVGHSNGGFMAHRLACESGSPFSAIVSLAGVTYLDPAKCKPSHFVSVLQIHAVNDPTVKYEGDPTGFRGMAPYPGSIPTVLQWAKLNHCQRNRVDGPVLRVTRDHETHTQFFQNCNEGVRVELWSIQEATIPILGDAHIPVLLKEFRQMTLDFLLSAPI